MLLDFWGLTMRRFRCAVLAAVAVVGFASVACAADIPMKAAPMVAPVAPYNWTGFYVGLNAGYAQNRIDASGEGLPIIPSTGALTFQDFQSSGGFGGAQVGYNYQWGHVVAGVEADAQWSGINGTSSFTFTTPIHSGGVCGAGCFGTRTFTQQMKSFETLRGRLGAAFDRVFIYGTAGFIWAQLDESANWIFPTPLATYPASSSRTGQGGVWGGGVEYAFANNWTAKAEALGYRLGSDTFVGNGTLAGVGTGAQYILRTDGWLVRGGINYRFGSL